MGVVTFTDIPSQMIRARLSQFGFHWNNSCRVGCSAWLGHWCLTQ
jgi:hypothetical protein